MTRATSAIEVLPMRDLREAVLAQAAHALRTATSPILSARGALDGEVADLVGDAS